MGKDHYKGYRKNVPLNGIVDKFKINTLLFYFSLLVKELPL